MSTITPAVNPNKALGVGKWLVKYALPALINAVQDLYTDGVGQVDNPADAQWRRLNWLFQRTTPVGTVEDRAMFGFDVVNMTGGNLDSSWTAADYTAVETAVNELWGRLRPHVAGSHTLVNVSYYLRQFHPDLPIGSLVPQLRADPITGKTKEVPRFTRAGAPLHVHTINSQGASAATSLPYQVAMSVTHRTAAKRHWGRCYLPGVTVGAESPSDGRFSSAVTQVIADAFAEFASDLGANDFFIMVPTTQHEGKYGTALSSVSQFVVDDVPDVIRRRRPKQASVRSVGVPAP